jgi:hypothetical protein
VPAFRPDLCSLLPVIAAAAAFAAALVRILMLLRWLPRTAGEPTVIGASPAGLFIATARSGRPLHYVFPAEDVTAVAVVSGPRTATLAGTVLLAVRHREADRTRQDAFQFTTREPGVAARLAAELCTALGRPVSVDAAWVDEWGNPTPI